MRSNVKPILVTFKANEGALYDLITSHVSYGAYIKECILNYEKIKKENESLKNTLFLYENMMQPSNNSTSVCDDIIGF